MKAISEVPDGLDRLRSWGGFVERETSADTEYHRVCDLGHQSLQSIEATSAFLGISPKMIPMMNPVVRLRELRLSKLRNDESGTAEWCVGGLETNRSLVQEVLMRCECGLSDTTRQVLQDWWNQANDLVTTGQNAQVNGCRILHAMHERGFVGAEKEGMASDLGAVLAPDVKAAAKLLAETLEDLAVSDISASPGGGAVLPDQPPKKYLRNWREILDTLDLKNAKENRSQISNANKQYDGPLIFVEQGKPPQG